MNRFKRIFAAVAAAAGFWAVGAGGAGAVSLFATGHEFDLNHYDPAGLPTGLSNGDDVLRQAGRRDGLYLLDGPARLTFTFMGREAAHLNTFTYAGGPGLLSSSAAGTSFTVASVESGLLPFSFFDEVTHRGVANGGAGHILTHGGRPHGSSYLYSIAVWLVNSTTAMVLFNDGGGDKDYDDMVVQVQITAVPLPAALPLLLTGLAGAGLLGRRRARRKAV